MRNSEFGTIFDADNHYWESHDAFTRYRDPQFNDRGLRLVEKDGVVRYYIGDKVHPILPGPGDLHGRPVPGSLFDYFAGTAPSDPHQPSLWSEKPAEHPEWYNRDARLTCMDAQGIEACWLFPSHGVCIEGPMQPDIEASLHILVARSTAGSRRTGVLRIRTASSPRRCCRCPTSAARSGDLEWAISRGARIITIRNGPVFTPSGMRSPADPVFDRFWARVEEAGITATVHAGFEDGYGSVDQAVGKVWNLDLEGKAKTMSVGLEDTSDFDTNLISMIQKHRLVRDFAAVLVAHGLFSSASPGSNSPSSKTGAPGSARCSTICRSRTSSTPACSPSIPSTSFTAIAGSPRSWRTMFSDLAKHIPVERILFGSDWPHAEGVGHPRDFFDNLAGFSDADKRKIMLENARQLTLA